MTYYLIAIQVLKSLLINIMYQAAEQWSKIYSNAAKIQYLYMVYMSQNKQELFSPTKCTVNGLTFEELKTIRNAIFADNVTLLTHLTHATR